MCLLVAEFKGFSSHPLGYFTGDSCSTALVDERVVARSEHPAAGCSLPRFPSKVLFLVTLTRTWRVVLGISCKLVGKGQGKLQTTRSLVLLL